MLLATLKSVRVSNRPVVVKSWTQYSVPLAYTKTSSSIEGQINGPTRWYTSPFPNHTPCSISQAVEHVPVLQQLNWKANWMQVGGTNGHTYVASLDSVLSTHSILDNLCIPSIHKVHIRRPHICFSFVQKRYHDILEAVALQAIKVNESARGPCQS